jgi:transcription antitermination protein NusB
MLTRRQIRVKVMQCIYALTLSKDDSLEKQEKFLNYSINQAYTLYLLMLSLFRELHQMAERHIELSSNKYRANVSDSYPVKEKFVNNKLLHKIVGNEQLSRELKRRKLKNWYLHEEYVKILFREITASTIYDVYMKSSDSSFEADRKVLMELFREVIAPNDKIYEYFEDDQLTWIDDLPLVNTFLLKRLKKVKPEHGDAFFLPSLVKDDDDLDFSKKLLVKTLLKDNELIREIEGKTPNWDKDRIADIDAILLKMAICELLNFPSIPERVTINEYLEIAKEYSTPKSSIFINGILDKLVKEYKSQGKLKKTGRGLL